MKKQIKRLSLHQNGKVFGCLIAVASLPFFLSTVVMMYIIAPQGEGSQSNLSNLVFLLFPLVYLFLAYLFAVIVCFVYNTLVKYIGGFEFILEDLACDE